jgi:protein SCO1/2
MQLMSNVVQQLGPEGKDVRILFVSVDPKRDSNTILKAYTAAFSPNAIGLTGAIKQIDALTRRYRVIYSYGKPDAQGNYVVDHSAGVYIFGRSGRIHLLGSDTNPPAAFVHDLKQLIADEG